MSTSRTFLCNTSDGECTEHGRWIYYCGPCQERWEQANPERVAAIRSLAEGCTPAKADPQPAATGDSGESR
jgi:hypothetical protein